MSNAEIAMGRLNDFFFYGRKLFVALAKFKTRQTFWRKVKTEEKRKVNPGVHGKQINPEVSEKKEAYQSAWWNKEYKNPTGG
ncbi:hypothetical protein V6N13_138369 [Hibiscus sabdariffa]